MNFGRGWRHEGRERRRKGSNEKEGRSDEEKTFSTASSILSTGWPKK